MRSSIVRLGIFISSLVIAALVVFQLIWLRGVYRTEQKEFNIGIVKSIRGLYEDLNFSPYYSSHLNELIENPEPNLYLARINLPVNLDSLTSYLHFELEAFAIFTNCHLGIYNADSGRYVYRGILALGGKDGEKAMLPATHRNFHYIALNFPNRKQYIISQMNLWIISGSFLVIMLILFGASIYYFYRQKFLAETQKDLIQNFTHEFKTPVSVLALAADVLKNPSIIEKPDKLATYAGIVDYQSKYLQTQIEKLLRFAHADSQHLRLNREKVNVHELVREAIANLDPLMKERDVQLELSLEATDPHLSGDRDYLVIVIVNLLDNAIKYSKDPIIRVSTSVEDGQFRLSVADQGIGIGDNQLKKIFRKFYRVRQGDTYSAKGFGLGLSFVKKIVEAHKGKVGVRSVPGSGSVFTIHLPFSK